MASTVSNGTLTLNADGSFTYEPAEDFHGIDTFTYTANDGVDDSDLAVVTIDVNDVPKATVDTYFAVEDNTLVRSPGNGVLVNDTDSDPLLAVLNTGVSHGTLDLELDGSFTYTPDANFTGSELFTYIATNGLNSSAPTQVSIIVNPIQDAPEAVADSYSTSQDTLLTRSAATGVLANDFDVDGDDLTAVLVTDVSDGALTFNDDGSFDYQPDAGFNGIDSFTYTAHDGTDDSVITTAVWGDRAVVGAWHDDDNSNPGLFTSTDIDEQTGELTLVFAPDSPGVADLTVRATDAGGLTVDAPFTISVSVAGAIEGTVFNDLRRFNRP